VGSLVESKNDLNLAHIHMAVLCPLGPNSLYQILVNVLICSERNDKPLILIPCYKNQLNILTRRFKKKKKGVLDCDLTSGLIICEVFMSGRVFETNEHSAFVNF
jgi:hypothetical protein